MLEQKPLLALDASVVINFLGSGIAEACFNALHGKVVLAEQVFAEVRSDPGKRIDPKVWLDSLQQSGTIEICGLTGEALSTYLELGAGGLDDGESATIALAVHRPAIAVLDDKRARDVYQRRYPDHPLSSTTDILDEKLIHGYLDRQTLQPALLSALQIAGMQVRPDRLDWIIDIIGIDNARQCPSLAKLLRLRRY